MLFAFTLRLLWLQFPFVRKRVLMSTFSPNIGLTQFAFEGNQILILRIGQVKVALNSVFGTRGKGTNGASARVLKNNFYFDDVTKNKVF